MFPQNHCRRQFGAALDVPKAVAAASDFGPAFGVSGSAERLPRPRSREVVEDYSQHSAENSLQPFSCSPFCNIVSTRLVSGA